MEPCNLKKSSFRWRLFIDNVQKDFKLILFFCLILTAYRSLLIFRFYRFFSSSVGLYDIFLGFAIGLRFDARISAYAALPVILSTLFGVIFPRRATGSDRLRKSMFAVFIILSAVICIINYMFIAEYKDNFNQWIFGLIYDDFGAVVKSMLKDSHVFIYVGIACAISFVVLKSGRRFLETPFFYPDRLEPMLSTRFHKTLVSAALLVLFIFAIRGSVGLRPVQMKDAGITKDPFLNKLVLNPYEALRYAVDDYLKLFSSAGIKTFIPDKNIQAAAQLYFSTTQSHDSLDEYFRKTVKRKNISPPRHIFLIVMESLDSWPLLNQYESFNLLPNIKSMGSKGILVKAFLPASTGTMPSFAALITGLPDADVFTNYQLSARSPFPTSMAPQFKALGYETNMFYGGYLSWQRIGDFCKAQGFDHVYGGGNMGKWENKEWGVDDNVLFEFIRSTLDNHKPTFNVILTTSNHTPYDLPVYEKGFPHHTIPQDLKALYSKEVPLKVFGHLWYSDKLLKEFIDEIEKKLPASLFAVTGDHWSRKHISANPSLYEKSSVPLLLYGKGLTPQSGENTAGSHMDILPTLIELSAPQGFVYYSMGNSLLENRKQPMGFSRNCVITPGYIINDKGETQKLPFPVAESHVPEPEHAIKRLNAYRGIGWWRVMKGPQLEH
jgi:phosphoglycerol transferase MdoB-like AlkP superfamily enzyme